MAGLFDPFTLRGVTLPNRIGVSPMCQFSSVDGFANAWHLVHLGSRAVGGAGLVITEAAAVAPGGRIAPTDLGIWKDAHIDGHRKLVDFIDSQGAVAGIQLAHAGRKASRVPPWETDPAVLQGRPLTGEEGAWPIVGASPLAFAPGYTVPAALAAAEIEGIVRAFADAARRADAAGYRWIEVHAAHGYLLHSFCSPLSNQRGDRYGGALEGRCRFAREVARAVRQAWQGDKVLSFRLSYTDWAEGGWSLDDTVRLSAWLREDGVDLIDASSGGNVARPTIPMGPGYQVPGAEAVRQAAGMPAAAVGLISDARHADAIVQEGRADMVMLGRELLRDPYWPLRAAVTLGKTALARVPVQYNSAWARLGSFGFDPINAPQVTVSGHAALDNARHCVLD